MSSSGHSLHHLFIVTGSSRGMGAAIARQLTGPGHRVIGIARRAGPVMAGLEQWQQDLAEPLAAAEQLQAWLAAQAPFASATLINNAGVISPPGPIERASLAELSNAIRVGLEATLLLSAAFLRATRPWGVPLKILNISSGLGRRAMAGSAPYCAAKAGMDNLSASMALDEAQRPGGARIVSLAPGVIDTDMQVQLRSADPAGFPEQQRFIDFKATGALMSPDEAAAKILAYLQRADFGSQPIADVRQA
jgi:NAD(P)-dependent dehydrogenase (short-subunit alcohol dehydrogenase family)